LEGRGHNVSIASNGAEALRAMDSFAFDLVLMDVQMPVMNGITATERIREKEKVSGGHIPIIAMTAFAMKDDQERFLASGMDGYIAKPMDIEETIRYIESLAHKPNKPEQLIEHLGSNIVLDRKSFMDRCANNLELASELINNYIEGYTKYLDDIREAIEANDPKRLHHSAHFLKGTSSIFSAQRTVKLALELLLMGKNAEMDKANGVFSQLVKEVELLVGELKEIAHPNENGQK
ncbi:MAG: response regulator, partial [Deltaproteobacteria bacterium]|nr:response regulator [Deltaproteobacteria bacterium]